jgi:hypothetical protein
MIRIVVATSLLLTSGLPHSVKDPPPPVQYRSTQTGSPTPLPERNEGRIQPYVLIERGGDVRLPLTPEEMEVYGFTTGQVIPLKDAARIVEEKLRREGR